MSCGEAKRQRRLLTDRHVTYQDQAELTFDWIDWIGTNNSRSQRADTAMSDHSGSSGSLGFVADRSQFRRESAAGGVDGGDAPHHFSASLNLDEGRTERPQSRSSTAPAQPSLKERARRRPSSSGMYGGDQQPVRRRMPRRPSIDAIKIALDTDQDLAKVAGGGRMPRRPSLGSLSAHSYDALGHALADDSDDAGGSPEHGRPRDRRAQRRPSMGSYQIALKDGDGGAGGGQRRRRAQRRPSMGSLDPSMGFNQDGGGGGGGVIRRNSSSFGSMRHMEELMGGAEGQQEKPMEYQEMRRRVPRRSSIEYLNRTPSSNSLGAMVNVVEAIEANAGRQDGRQENQERKNVRQKKQKQKQQSRGRRSSRASQSSRRSESSNDSAYVSHPLENQQQSQTPPPSDTNAPSKQRRRVSRRASAEDGLIPVKKDSLKDIIARRPSGSALDMEGSSKRRQALEQFGTLQSSSTIEKESYDDGMRRDSVGSSSTSTSRSSSNGSTSSNVSDERYRNKSKKDRSPSSIISAEAQLAADVSSAGAFNQSYRHESSHLSKRESLRSVSSSHSRDRKADMKQEEPMKQGTNFYGWGEDGSVTESEYSQAQPIEKKEGVSADDAEVYVGFTNREEFRERVGTVEESHPVEIEEEFDAKRPWRKANADELRKSSSKGDDISGSNSIKSFNVDEMDANVDVKGKATPFDDDIESIGARRRNSSAGSIDVLRTVHSARNDDGDEISSTSESTLSEFAYAQAVLKRSMPMVDNRPTKTSIMRRRSNDSGDMMFRDVDFDESSEEDPAEAAAIIAQMYRDERQKKIQPPREDIREESRGSSLHLSSGDSLDLEAAIAREEKKRVKAEAKATVSPAARTATSRPNQEQQSRIEKAPSTRYVEEPSKKVAEQQDAAVTYENEINGSNGSNGSIHHQEEDRVGHENKSKKTFEYWNDGYGDVDNRAYDRRAPVREESRHLMSSIASNPAVAYKMGKSAARNAEEAQPFVDAEDGRAGSFASRKTTQASNAKDWDDEDNKSALSHDDGSLMADFPASQKTRGSLEKLVGPKVWQRRKPIFIGLGALLVLIIAIAVGVSVSKNNKGTKPPPAAPTPSPTPMETKPPLPTRPPAASPLPYVPLQTVSGTAIFDHAGSAVSFNSLGTHVAIGSKQNKSGTSESMGITRVYALIGGTWQQVGSDIKGSANGDEFGSSVSLSDDGQRVAIGAPNSDVDGESSGSVEIYDMQDDWTKIGGTINGAEKLDRAGFSVSLSGDGRRIAVGAPRGGEDTGSVRVFEEVNGKWTQLGQEIFGESVAVLAGYAVSLSLKGDTLAVSSPRASTDKVARGGSVSLYTFVDPSTSPNDASWQLLGSPISGDASGDQCGESIALSSDGRYVAIGANGRDGGRYKNVGYCRVFRFNGQLEEWEQDGQAMYGRNQGEQMGSSISLSRDATAVACGGPNSRDRSGMVRVYAKQAGEDWSQIGDDLSGPLGSAFGSSLALSRDGAFLIVGAPEADVEGNERAGIAELYTSL